MIAAVSAISSHVDPEYYRILQELMRFGIAPSGNKSIDKSKLEQAKAELVQKIQLRQQESESNASSSYALLNNDEDNRKRAQLEEERLGAMTVSELNRLYFGI